MADITLYSFHRCPFAIRVRMVLHEKGLPFEIKEEDLKNFSPELRSLHPEAKVPVLVHKGEVIYESAVITEYLNEAFPVPSLMPESPSGRAQVRLWTYWCNSLFKPDLDRFKYGTSRFKPEDCEGVSERIQKHLEKLEGRLSKFPYLVGDSLTLADIHVFPFLRQLARMEPTPTILSTIPQSLKWLELITSRPAFEKTMKK